MQWQCTLGQNALGNVRYEFIDSVDDSVTKSLLPEPPDILPVLVYDTQ